MSVANDNSANSSMETISRVAVKIPPLWKSNISVWFVQVEANFSVAQITDDTTKYNYVLSSIDTDTLSAVTDLILTPPTTDKYNALKERLIKEFSDSQSQQIRKLLSELTLGDKKPSVLLRQMKELAKSSVSDDFLKAIWLERLPTQTQAILSVSTAELPELATLADKIVEIKSEHAVYAVSKPTETSHTENNQIIQLQKQIDQLSIQVSTLSKSLSQRSSSRERIHYRNRSQSRNRRFASRERNTNESGFCYYHHRFGKNAKKCSEPCKFIETQKKLVSAARLTEKKSFNVAALKQCRLHVFDKNSGLKFLIDSGSDISCLPVPNKLKAKSPTNYLYAANNSKIPVYGTKLLDLNIGIRRSLRWSFVIADVSCPIIGADFLKNFALLVDLNKSQLIDSSTKLTTKGDLATTVQPQIKLISDDMSHKEFFEKFPDLLNPKTNFIKKLCHDTVHHIETSGPPLFSKPRRLHPKILKEVQKEFQYLMDEGICRPSKSPWASPIHVVPKPDGSYRVCGDYRRLNSVTLPDRYPIPHIHDLTNILNGKKIFSKIDIVRAYFHIPVHEKDIPKTAVTTPFGSFEFLYLNFGLKCAANTFQRFINEVLFNLPFAIAYLDDILIFSENTSEHQEHVRTVLERLSNYGLNINVGKCVFNQTRVSFLGHEISPDGIRPMEAKVEIIKHYPRPKTLSELRKFIGLLNYFRRFIRNAATLLAPLTDLLRGAKKRDSTPVEWTEKLISSFEAAKLALTDAALAFPSQEGQLTLHSDASDFAVGSTLSLKTSEGLKPLAFFSKRLNETQLRYSSFDRELLAIYESVKHFRHFLEARECTIFTDHKPIVYAFRKRTDNYTNRQSRWLSFISEFTTDIVFLNGEKNEAADALSRINEIHMPTLIDYEKLSKDQTHDVSLKKLIEDTESGLELKLITLPNSNIEIYCDVSTGKARPYLTPEFRKQAFLNLHQLSHPGIKGTVNLVRKRFVWPSLSKDCQQWVRECLGCQRSKIHRHTKTELGKFDIPTDRFSHIHLDLVGPLPESNGKSYCLTVIDRATRWPEAYPLSDITAQTVAHTLVSEWVSRFGCPEKITTDQGRQFESELFRQLSQLLGAKKYRTSPYHPQSNGLIENWHRPLKCAIKARRTERWTEVLPTILLGFRATLKADINASPAELVFGSTLRLPGDFFDEKSSIKNPGEFVRRLSDIFHDFTPVPTKSHHISKPFVSQDFSTCTHVFVRHDGFRQALQPPYDGPFKVIERKEKFFKVTIRGRNVNISLDRLKPAFVVNDEPDSRELSPHRPGQDDLHLPESSHHQRTDLQHPKQQFSDLHETVSETPITAKKPIVTRSGRTVRFADRLVYR